MQPEIWYTLNYLNIKEIRLVLEIFLPPSEDFVESAPKWCALISFSSIHSCEIWQIWDTFYIEIDFISFAKVNDFCICSMTPLDIQKRFLFFFEFNQTAGISRRNWNFMMYFHFKNVRHLSLFYSMSSYYVNYWHYFVFIHRTQIFTSRKTNIHEIKQLLCQVQETVQRKLELPDKSRAKENHRLLPTTLRLFFPPTKDLKVRIVECRLLEADVPIPRVSSQTWLVWRR